MDKQEHYNTSEIRNTITTIIVYLGTLCCSYAVYKLCRYVILISTTTIVQDVI